DAHQGRLAGAVLADDAVDRARSHDERDVPVRVDVAKPLVDTPQLDRRRSAIFYVPFRYGPLRAAALPPQSSPGEASEGAVGAPSEFKESEAPSELFSHVVGDLDLAGDDVGAGLLEPLLHVGGDETPVVLVERVADAALGHAERADARLPDPFLRGLERLVHREVDALDHRGQDRPGMDVVLVRVDADGEPALA